MLPGTSQQYVQAVIADLWECLSISEAHLLSVHLGVLILAISSCANKQSKRLRNSDTGQHTTLIRNSQTILPKASADQAVHNAYRGHYYRSGSSLSECCGGAGHLMRALPSDPNFAIETK